jgi:hypothetical protein
MGNRGDSEIAAARDRVADLALDWYEAVEYCAKLANNGSVVAQRDAKRSLLSIETDLLQAAKRLHSLECGPDA